VLEAAYGRWSVGSLRLTILWLRRRRVRSATLVWGRLAILRLLRLAILGLRRGATVLRLLGWVAGLIAVLRVLVVIPRAAHDAGVFVEKTGGSLMRDVRMM